MSLPDLAEVWIGDAVLAGHLERLGESSRFVPTQQWAETPSGKRLVLGQAFEDDPYAMHHARTGAPIWFEHLLPEAGGPLRKKIADGLGINESRSFPLLLALGENLPGAVRIVETDEGNRSQRASRSRRSAASPSADDRGPGAASVLRVSLAGLQFKLSATEGRRGFSVSATSGADDWILKIGDNRFPDLAMNEHTTMSWARASGLRVPETRVVATSEVDGIDLPHQSHATHAFAVKRYDRSPCGAIHQEDFAQVASLSIGDAKYAGITVDGIVRIVANIAAQDVEELIARIVFMVLSGNDDAHAKNWSLWYPDGISARLAPAYDLVSTLQLTGPNDMALKLAGTRRFDMVDSTTFAELAKGTGLDPARITRAAAEAAARQRCAWEQLRTEIDLPEGYREFIDLRLSELPLAQGL